MGKLRRITKNDVSRVVELHRANCKEATGAGEFSPKDTERLTSWFSQCAAHNEAFCWVSENGQGVAGYIVFSLGHHPVQPGKVGVIEELYVEPGSRKQGIGRELVNRATGVLRENQVDVFRVTANVDQAGAKAFWQKLGWESDLTTFSLYDFGQSVNP